MSDVFDRGTDQFDGSFAANRASMTFAASSENGRELGLLIQGLQTSFRQQVTRLYEVGRPVLSYVGGRVTGDFFANHIIGSRAVQGPFHQTFGDINRDKNNSLTFACGSTNYGARNANSVSYTCRSSLIIMLGRSLVTKDLFINEALQMMFGSFEHTGSSSIELPPD